MKTIRVIDSCHAQVACECGNVYVVSRDEDGEATTESLRCHVEGCKSVACDDCATRCDSCSSMTCADHLTDIEGDQWCCCCVAEYAASGEPDYVEVA